MIRIFDYKIPTVVDYPGRIAAVLFLKGCNFFCDWCHNNELKGKISNKGFSIDFVISELKKYKGRISGIVITGGEPTLYGKQLIKLLQKLKNETTYNIKFDTNGSNPILLKEIIDKKLVNYIAMDVKATKAKYEKCIGRKFDIKILEDSINIIKNSGIEYRFRTTCGHQYTPEEDIKAIEEEFKVKLYIQKYRENK